MSEAIYTLLSLLDPTTSPAWLYDMTANDGTEAEEAAVGTALPIAFPDDYDDDNPVWSPAIRAWLGDAVMARLQKRLNPLLLVELDRRAAEGESEDG